MCHPWFKELTFSRHHDVPRNWPRCDDGIMLIPRFLGLDTYLKDVMARASSTFNHHLLQRALDKHNPFSMHVPHIL